MSTPEYEDRMRAARQQAVRNAAREDVEAEVAALRRQLQWERDLAAAVADELRGECRQLREMIAGLAAGVEAQAELLTRRAKEQ